MSPVGCPLLETLGEAKKKTFYRCDYGGGELSAMVRFVGDTRAARRPDGVGKEDVCLHIE